METAVLYTNGGIESDRVRQLLQSLDGEYLEYQLGVDFNERDFAREFGAEAEYPQVAIGLKHRGDLKETLHYLNNHNYKCSC